MNLLIINYNFNYPINSLIYRNKEYKFNAYCQFDDKFNLAKKHHNHVKKASIIMKALRICGPTGLPSLHSGQTSLTRIFCTRKNITSFYCIIVVFSQPIKPAETINFITSLEFIFNAFIFSLGTINNSPEKLYECGK